MSRQVIQQLKRLRREEVNPSPEWVESNRKILLTQARNTKPAISPDMKARTLGIPWEKAWEVLALLFPSAFVYKVVRPVVVSLLILGIGAGGWIATVDASYNAIPGDWLYSTKRAAEKTQITIASVVGNKTTETKLHAEFAKRRAIETKKVAASTDPSKIAKVGELVKDLKDEMRTVNSKLDQIRIASAKSLPAEAAKTVRDSSEQITEVLKEVKNNLLTASSTVSSSVAGEINSAREMAQDNSIKAVEVIAVRHLSGDASVTREDAQQAITRQLQTTVNEVAESRQNVEDVRVVVETVQTEVREMARGAGNPALNAIATTTDALANRVNQAAEMTEKASAEAGRQAQSARELISSGNLTQALGVVRQVNETNRQVESINDNTLQAVQTVLPVVGVVRDIGPTTSTSPANMSMQVMTTVATTTRSAAGTAVTSSVVLIVSTTPAQGSTTTRYEMRSPGVKL